MMGPINQKDSSLPWDTRMRFDKNKNTILVIDDELGPRESLRILFKGIYNVITAEDGEKGIRIFRENKDIIDAIILDLKMPKKSGIETLEEIRKIDEKVPVIILTGYGDMETAKKAIHLGTLEFMSKPFNVDEMEEIVRRAVNKRKAILESEKLKEELTLLNSRLNERIAQMEKLATIGQLSSEIIHEVNNLLTVIHGYTQLLLQEISAENISSKYLLTIESEIKRCKNIARSILEIAKSKAEARPMKDVSLNEIIRKIIEFLEISNIAKGIKFSLSLENDLPLIKGEPNHLHQAILNILINSIQAMNKKGEISIRTEKEKGKVLLIIKDTGKGIPQDIIDKITEPFFTTKKEGAGLGLSIASRIIKNHNGELKIFSKIGEGTEFKIYFPVSTLNMN